MSDITWRKEYNDKTLSVSAALARIPDGATVFVEPGAGEPRYLVDNLLPLVESKGLKLLFGWSLRTPPLFAPDYYPKPAYFYVTKAQRDALDKGLIDTIPLNISEIPLLIRKGQLSIDAALVQLGPPDSHGQLSLGVAVDITRSVIMNTPLVIAQVNRFMPRTHGSSFIDHRKVTWFVRESEELAEIFPTTVNSEVEQQLGFHIAHLIPDGATIHIGPGRVPTATVRECFGKRDIGIHSTMISDWAMELIEAGTVTNLEKPIHRGKVVASFAMGTRRFYEYMDDSPLFELRSADYLNDPEVITRHDRFVSVNGAHKIDLTGQVFNKERPIEFFSHIGGIGEISRNAIHAQGGRNILVVSSMDKTGESNIIPVFSSGEALLLGRADVDYVVTEYGFARLRGMSVRERSLRLIGLAHPDVRGELTSAALERRYFPPNLPQKTLTRAQDYPWHYGATADNHPLLIRTATVADFDPVLELYRSLGPRELALRFFSDSTRVGKYIVDTFAHDDHTTLLAFIQTTYGEVPAGILELVTGADSGAEFALAVSPQQRHRGIGRRLVEAGVSLAQKRALSTLSCEVLLENTPMMSLLRTLDGPWEREEKQGSVVFTRVLGNAPLQP